MDNLRLTGYCITVLGAVVLLASALVYPFAEMPLFILIPLLVLSTALFVIGILVLVRTKPPHREDPRTFDEPIPGESVSFEDWAKRPPVDTYKSERPDPNFKKPGKQYKPFPGKREEQ